MICHMKNLLFPFFFFCISSLVAQDKSSSPIRKSDLVEPMVDAAHSRFFYFNSASRPFGMVNLSPDMNLRGTWNTGYRYNEDTIKCFSHVHCWEMSGIPVLPVTGIFKGHLGPDKYGSSYSHKDELARPGYHRVVLKDYGIKAELTSTARVGFHRYTFPSSDSSQILFDFTTVLGSSETQSAAVRKINDHSIEGQVTMEATIRRPKPITIYFVAELDKPMNGFAGWKQGERIDAMDRIEGVHTGVVIQLKTAKSDVRKMKIAISYTSVNEAKNNLLAELPHWDFDRVVKESAQEWDQWLSRIDVYGGTVTAQRRFYTDLYHALQGRRIVSDVSGTYIDNTGATPLVKKVPLDANGKPRFRMYNSDSFWGAQWSLNTLWHLVYPEVTEEFINCMLQMYDDGGLIPRGPSGGNYTYVMTGAPTTPFIVSAYLKGIRGFDVQKAYQGMRKDHFPGGMMSKAGYEHKTFKGGGIEEYMSKGYIPFPLAPIKYGFHQDGTALTLEYAYQDYALSQMAKSMGRSDDYQLFLSRSKNYNNVFYKEIGWMWNRNHAGDWEKPVDILRYENGFNEGNAAQYSWFVPHDVKGLIALHGGADSFTRKLDFVFKEAQKHGFVSGKSENPINQEMLRRVYINYGNQPCMQTPFLFNYAGKPWLTQFWTRQLIDSVYSGLSPQSGYSGDEDQGLMGSLAVLLKIGLFSTDGGTNEKPFYEISSPIFNKIVLHLNDKYYPGKQFVIEAVNNGPRNIYVQQAKLNGSPLNTPFFDHATLIKGGKLELSMGSNPNRSWGNGQTSSTAAMPNIIYILADDLGYGDVKVYNNNSKIATPNIDKLAMQGMRFTDAHSTSGVCTPTRYSVMTGRYPWRSQKPVGVLNGFSRPLIENDRATVASLLKENGYNTGVIGKWHLGLGWTPKREYAHLLSNKGYGIDNEMNPDHVDLIKGMTVSPKNNGFDYSYVLPASLDMQPYCYVENGQLASPLTAITKGNKPDTGYAGAFWRPGYMSPDFDFFDVIPGFVRKANDFIRNQTKEKPFFLYLPLPVPHTPWMPTNEFRGKSKAGEYGDFTEQLDASVGMILKTLDSMKLSENTIVIFTSDNGPYWREDYVQKFQHQSAGPWRGMKGDAFEGGHRVPFIVRWPGKIKAGTVSHATITHANLMATAAELVSNKDSRYMVEDSYSILSVLQGKTARVPRQEAVVHHSSVGYYAIRKGDWKLIVGLGSGGFTVPKMILPQKGEPSVQLFNLNSDPHEDKNVASLHPEIVKELMEKLDQIKQTKQP